LGPLNDQGLAVSRDAGRRLSSSAKRVYARGDLNAAVNLGRRAIALFPEDDAERLTAMPALAEALTNLGNFEEARAVLADAHQIAEQRGNARILAACRLIGFIIDYYSGAHTGDWSNSTLQVISDLVPSLERL